MWELKTLNLDYTKNSKEKLEQLNEFEEFRIKEYENLVLYKENMKMWNATKILKREFKIGDWVILYNSKLRLFYYKSHVQVAKTI